MSQNKNIRVDPQELRDLGTHFRHVSADIQQLVTDLRSATADLDTGAWTGDEAARLSARFAEAEALGQRRAAAHAELGDRLCRAADAFEEADNIPWPQILEGLPGDSEPAPGRGKVPGLARTMPDAAPRSWRAALLHKWRALLESFSISPRYVTSPIGLHLRQTPTIPEGDYEGNLALEGRIPEGARVFVHTNIPSQVANDHRWGYVTYIDGEGQVHRGWVALTYLRSFAFPDIAPPVSRDSDDNSCPPFGLPFPSPAISGHHFGKPVSYNTGLRGGEIVGRDENGNPIYYWQHHHPGVDYAPPGGNNHILASETGIVAASGYQNAYGNYVIIEHRAETLPLALQSLPEYSKGDSVYIIYAHIEAVAGGLPAAGTRILRGDPIGVVGNTGANTTGAHLHAEVRVGAPDLPVNATSGIWYNVDLLPPIDPHLIFDPATCNTVADSQQE